MAKIKAVQVGNKVIRARARTVQDVQTPETKKVIRDLIDSLRYNNLVGMAAPQIGKDLRIFVSEIRKTKYRKNLTQTDVVRVFINPRIIRFSQKSAISYEGCGSVAYGGLFGLVKRHAEVTVSALDMHGKRFTLEAGGLLALIIQHELDHLNGVVFIDKVTDTRKFLGKEEYLRFKTT